MCLIRGASQAPHRVPLQTQVGRVGRAPKTDIPSNERETLLHTLSGLCRQGQRFSPRGKFLVQLPQCHPGTEIKHRQAGRHLRKPTPEMKFSNCKSTLLATVWAVEHICRNTGVQKVIAETCHQPVTFLNCQQLRKGEVSNCLQDNGVARIQH